MSIIVLLAPALVPNASFPTPNGNTYLSDSLGLIRNVANVDLPYMLGLGCRVAAPRDNKSATVAPTSSNDYTQLYDTGSLWINTGTSPATVYVNVTGFPASAAVWSTLGAGPTGPAGPAGPTGPGGQLTGILLQKSAAYAVVNADKGKTIYCKGSTDYTISLAGSVNYDADFAVRVFNSSTANNAVLLSVPTIGNFYVYPGQSYIVQNDLPDTSFFMQPTTQRWQIPSGSFASLYVGSGGSDSNSGLSTAYKFLTIQPALDAMHSFIHAYKGSPTINLDLNQTYSVGSGLQHNYILDGGVELFIIGQTGVNLPNVVFSCTAGGNCVFSREPATSTWEGITYSTSGNSSTAVSASQFATLDLEGGFAFGNFPLGTHIGVADAASVNVLSNYEVFSNANAHILCSHSYVNYGSFGCVVANPLTFAFWIDADAAGFVNSGGVAMSFSGAGSGAGSTGAKYAVTASSLLDSAGATFPGASAGTTTTGGTFR